MKIEKTDYHKLPFAGLFCDYIRGENKTDPFFEYRHSYDQLVDAVSNFSFPGDRTAMSEITKKFNSDFSLASEAIENLNILSDNNTVTIVTGQQTNIYGGPLFTVYKTLSVISLARSLTRDTGRKVVPVFWMADEDHDFDEISKITLPANKSLKKIRFSDIHHSNHAAGDVHLQNDIEKFRQQVFELLPDTDFNQSLKYLLNYCYTPQKTIKQAFGDFLTALFSHQGLILAGSHFREAKVYTKEKIQTAITDADKIQEALTHQSEKVTKSYHQQAQVPDNLLFMYNEASERIRLHRKNDRWFYKSGNVSFSTEELLKKAEVEPESFSPNIFLRPILQDALLPNAAYVAGPAEVSYYAQMKPVYAIFNQSMPFIAGRFSATIMEPSIQRHLKKIPFQFHELMNRIEELERDLLKFMDNRGLDHQIDNWKKDTEALSRQVIENLGITNEGLIKHNQAITKDYIKSIEKFRKKIIQTMRQKEEVQINRLNKVKQALFPHDRLQEREVSFVYYINKYGMDIWDNMLEELGEREERLFLSHYLIKL